MEIRYNLIVEAITEWFMQLFFDPMYHFSPHENNSAHKKSPRLVWVKKKTASIWHKAKSIAHLLFVKEKVHITILLYVSQDIIHLAKNMLSRFNGLSRKIHLIISHMIILSLQRGFVFLPL